MLALRSTGAEPTLNTVETEAIEQGLRARLATIQERLAKLSQAPERGADLAFGKRIGDGTTEAVSRLTDVGVGESLEVSEGKILRALAKLEDGTYGRCDVCGEPINPRRLEALPESTICIDHAR
jgi:DnaK suppressor protein